MEDASAELAGHPDRLRWNARYGTGTGDSIDPHPLAVRAMALPPPDGPVLDLACGPSGSALLAAAAGREVTAVDVSDVALGRLDQEACRRGLRDRITLVHADLGAWRPAPDRYALVLCTGFWDRAVFAPAVRAVAPGGVLGWEAFTARARLVRPGLPARWCLAAGEPASLLPAGFDVADQHDLPGAGDGGGPGDGRLRGHGAKRRLLAVRAA